jgi:hypothetical protein
MEKVQRSQGIALRQIMWHLIRRSRRREHVAEESASMAETLGKICPVMAQAWISDQEDQQSGGFSGIEELLDQRNVSLANRRTANGCEAISG